jgi:lysophospholipase L1-like esterase
MSEPPVETARAGYRRQGLARDETAEGALRRVRVCVLGDDLVAGIGDARALGWVGRVAARTPREQAETAVFALGVPGETTAELLGRWREESARRFAGIAPEDCRVVIGLGREDVYQLVSLPRSRLNLANLLDECALRQLAAFVVGPPPGPDERLNTKIGELSGAFADVCQRRRVPYVDTFTPLLTHEDWLTDLAAGDGRHPGQAGYGLIAWLVLHGGWNAFLGLPTS